MKRATVFVMATSLAILFSKTLTGFAQPPGLAIVDISNVVGSVATNIRVDDSKIPLTVQVPIEVAANVCGVAANALTQNANGKRATCKAKMTSAALDQHVRQQVMGNEQK